MSKATEKPTVFIGSSSEDLRISGQIQFDLQQIARPQIWSQGVFGLGWGTLEALMTSLERYDFAILVLSPNDVITSRDVTTSAPRDNVIFELGLFMGRLGPRRTFIFYDRSVDLKLLSDLVGITKAGYDGDWANENLAAAIGAACQPIRETIRALGPLLKPPAQVGGSTRNRILEELLNDISSLPRMMSSEEREYWKEIKEHTATGKPYILSQSFSKASPEYHPLLSLRKKLIIRATKGATFAPGKRIEISRFGKLLMDMESGSES
jgi:hypothetical protein